MTPGRGDETFLAAGGPARHVPVLRDEVMAALAPREGGLYLDATFGAGGYARALLAMPELRVLALDRDPIAIAEGAVACERSAGAAISCRTSGSADSAKWRGNAGFPISTGWCSTSASRRCKSTMPRRGFSFRGEGPLDMRMDCEGTSAADLVNTAGETTLANIFYYFGEERASRRIARCDRHGPRQDTLHVDRRARVTDRPCRAWQARRDASGDTRLSSAAHRCQ